MPPARPAKKRRLLRRVLAALAIAGLCFGLGIFIGNRKRASLPPLTLRHSRLPSPDEFETPRPADEGPALIVAGGLVCTGLETPVPAAEWQVTCLAQRLPAIPGQIVRIPIPEALAAAHPSSVTVTVPGWTPTSVKLPARDTHGDWAISTPLTLPRETARISLAMPASGTDYDTLAIEWLQPLDGEPRATPPSQPQVVPLTFKRSKICEPLPTGFYRLVLQSRTPERIADFVLIPSLVLRATASQSPPPSFSLPPSISRSYTGLADSAPDPQDDEYPVGFFCGVNIDVRRNSGEAILAFQSLRREQTLRYTSLRPRPDTVWPVTNLYLADPAHLTFDCPLSHADHRLTLDLADGRATLLAEVLMPDDRDRMREMLERMVSLIQSQAHDSLKHPERFDPRYLKLPVNQLPNYDSLLSLDKYARHLTRIAQSPLRQIEIGAQIVVRHNGRSGWSVNVVPQAGPAAP
jgi:hypothetical protein